MKAATTTKARPTTGRTRHTSAPIQREPVRASQRGAAVAVNLAEWQLRMLMVEQCRTNGGTGWATYYRGTRGELQAAGVPAEAFPVGTEERRFELQTVNVCSSGRREKLQAVMTPDTAPGMFELAVFWHCPPYTQAAHPALHELARLLVIDAGDWLRMPGDWESTEAPVARLAADPRTDYRPAAVPRLRFSRESHELLTDAAHRLFELMHHYGEIMPMEAKAQAATPAAPGLHLVQGGAA